CLKTQNLQETILYIVTTLGVPLKVDGAGRGMGTEYASVDSELALLYGKLKGQEYRRAGWIVNPFYAKRDAPFRHPQFPISLVTRLSAYNVSDVKAMIDRSLAAHNRGKFVLDLSSSDDKEGNNWLRTASLVLPQDRLVLDESTRVLYDQREVIGYGA